MSFILDALKKSETERQEQATAEFATVPRASGEAQTPRWMWVLIGLLVVNVVVVALLMLRPDRAPAVARQEAPGPAPVMARSETVARQAPSFAERLDATEVERPSRQPAPSARTTPVEAAEPSQPAPRAAPPVVAPSSSNLQSLPTLNEVRLNNGLNLPDLNLDIHVFSSTPADRFVFVNMTKLREGDVLDSGPTVREITPDGVILSYQGQQFTLPRE